MTSFLPSGELTEDNEEDYLSRTWRLSPFV
jgi:hypothetical protein